MRGLFQAVFLINVAFCFYVLAGYPLLLAYLASRSRRPIGKRLETKTVTVLLPVRNGERWIRAKLESILRLDYPAAMVDVLVISDGSTDETDHIVQQFAGAGNIELVRIPPGGKAAALNVGLARARGEILFLTDVRQALDPGSLRNLVACFADPSIGAASGELIIREGESREELSVGQYWKYEKWIRRRLSRIDSVMGATGCIYAIRRELAPPLPPGLLVDDMFLPLAAFFRGYRVILDDSAKAFDYPTSLDVEFRRKIRTLAGVYQIIGCYPALLTPRNRMLIHFLSHKLSRLLLPYSLILIAAGSFALSEPWRTVAVLGEAGFYALALVDIWVPQSWRLKRISSPVRSFVVLLAAAFCAAFVIFLPVGRLWTETQVRSTTPLS